MMRLSQFVLGMAIKLGSILLVLNLLGCISIHSQQLSNKLLVGT